MAKKASSKSSVTTPESFSLLTDFDIHLFKTGKHFKLYEKLGLTLYRTATGPERTLVCGHRMQKRFLSSAISTAGIMVIINFIPGGMSRVYGKVFLPISIMVKHTSMPSIPIPENTWRRRIRLPHFAKHHPKPLRSSGHQSTTGRTPFG